MLCMVVSYSTMLIVAAYQSFFFFLLFRFHLQPCVFVHRTGTKQYPPCPFKQFSSKNYGKSLYFCFYLSLSENYKTFKLKCSNHWQTVLPLYSWEQQNAKSASEVKWSVNAAKSCSISRNICSGLEILYFKDM